MFRYFLLGCFLALSGCSSEDSSPTSTSSSASTSTETVQKDSAKTFSTKDNILNATGIYSLLYDDEYILQDFKSVLFTSDVGDYTYLFRGVKQTQGKIELTDARAVHITGSYFEKPNVKLSFDINGNELKLNVADSVFGDIRTEDAIIDNDIGEGSLNLVEQKKIDIYADFTKGVYQDTQNEKWEFVNGFFEVKRTKCSYSADYHYTDGYYSMEPVSISNCDNLTANDYVTVGMTAYNKTTLHDVFRIFSFSNGIDKGKKDSVTLLK